SGRHRYYRLTSPQVHAVLEALAPLAAEEPVRSLRQSTRASALRAARTCYDHLAGRLGVAVTQALVSREVLVATDGIQDTRRRPGDRLSSQLPTHPYQLGPSAVAVLTDLGVPPLALSSGKSGRRRPLLRFCLDWSEQRHHLAGRLGAELLAAFLSAGWIERSEQHRALRLTDTGSRELHARLGAGI
ncbi:MAG: transcriptional regulator, partial [Trebonia sp.]